MGYVSNVNLTVTVVYSPVTWEVLVKLDWCVLFNHVQTLKTGRSTKLWMVNAWVVSVIWDLHRADGRATCIWETKHHFNHFVQWFGSGEHQKSDVARFHCHSYYLAYEGNFLFFWLLIITWWLCAILSVIVKFSRGTYSYWRVLSEIRTWLDETFFFDFLCLITPSHGSSVFCFRWTPLKRRNFCFLSIKDCVRQASNTNWHGQDHF